MIIPDELLIFSFILLAICIYIKSGLKGLIISIGAGVLSFLFMFALKKIGDFLFKKESMGGGDIKLMFILGLTLGFPEAILTVFLASFIGLPVSLWILYKKKNHEIPFGPFLAVGAIIILLFRIDMNFIINLLTWY